MGVFLGNVSCLASHAPRAAAHSCCLRIECSCLLLDYWSGIILLVPILSAVALICATVLGVAVWAALALFVRGWLVMLVAFRDVHCCPVVVQRWWDLLSFIDHIQGDDIHRFDYIVFLRLLGRFCELSALHRRSRARKRRQAIHAGLRLQNLVPPASWHRQEIQPEFLKFIQAN